MINPIFNKKAIFSKSIFSFNQKRETFDRKKFKCRYWILPSSTLNFGLQEKELISLDNDLTEFEKPSKHHENCTLSLSPTKIEKNLSHLPEEETNETNSEEANSHKNINFKISDSLECETQNPHLNKASKFLIWRSKNHDTIQSMITLSKSQTFSHHEFSRSLKPEKMIEFSKSEKNLEIFQNFEKVSLLNCYFPLGNCDRILVKLNKKSEVYQSKIGKYQISKPMTKLRNTRKKKRECS